MTKFISYIVFIGASASNLPYMTSSEYVSETCPDIDPSTETVLDFEGSTLETETLNANGGELKFGGIAGTTSAPIDLVITKTAGTTYTPKNANNNGLSGHYGQINILSLNGEGTFDFCFETNGVAVTLDAFFFSVLDLDGTDTGSAVPLGLESTTIERSEFTSVYLDENTEIEHSDVGGSVTFNATTIGDGDDNPTDPNALTAEQQTRTMTFLIEDTQCFTLKFAVNCMDESCNGGRNFFLGGKLGQVVPTCAPTESPGAYGDPHISTWRGESYDFHGICDLVLFSNPSFDNGSGVDVHIRNKQMRMWSFIETTAIRIGKDIFELAGGKDNDTFLINGVVERVKMENGVVGSISGYNIKFTQVDKNSRKFVINLGTKHDINKPYNNYLEEIVFTTWNSFVSVSVKNPTMYHFDGSLGLMGSFPSGEMVARDAKTVLNDSNEFGVEWQVLSSEPQLFSEAGTVGPNDECSTPSSVEMRRRLQASLISLKEAEVACNFVTTEMKDVCIFDVIATNDKLYSGAY